MTERLLRIRQKVRRDQLLARKHKTIIHSIIIACTTVAIVLEGPRLADLCFLFFAVVCEVC